MVDALQVSVEVLVMVDIILQWLRDQRTKWNDIHSRNPQSATAIHISHIDGLIEERLAELRKK